MFPITEDPSSGCLVQCLAKIARMVLSNDKSIIVIFSQALYKAPK